jgi:hypothetical protein
MMKKVSVASISNIGTRECSPPRWRAMNVEGIKIDESLSTQGGLLVTDQGLVQGLWVSYSSQNEKGKDISFMSGLSASLIQPTIQRMQDETNLDRMLTFKGLDIELWTMRLAAARTLGLSDDWIKKLEQSGSKRYTLLYVLNILDERSAVSDLLHVGDLVLTLQGKLVTRMTDLSALQNLDTVKMVILRDGVELEVDVPLSTFSGYETTEVIGWQGALIQRPYKAVLEQVRNVPTGVYVSCTLYGSPASSVLRPGVWIVEVQGQPVLGLDSFLELVHTHQVEMKRRRPSYIPPVRRSVEHRELPLEDIDDKKCLRADDDDDDDDNNDEGYIRIKTISRNDIVRVVALKLDLHYWTTWRLTRDDDAMSGWMANVV